MYRTRREGKQTDRRTEKTDIQTDKSKDRQVCVITYADIQSFTICEHYASLTIQREIQAGI